MSAEGLVPGMSKDEVAARLQLRMERDVSPESTDEFQTSIDSLIQEGEALAAVGKVLKGLNRRTALKVLIITAVRYDLYEAAREAIGVLERLPKEEPQEESDAVDYSKCSYCPKPATRLLTSPMIVGSKGVPFCADDHDVQQTPQYKILLDPKFVALGVSPENGQ
jgi:hypothetical protein